MLEVDLALAPSLAASALALAILVPLGIELLRAFLAPYKVINTYPGPGIRHTFLGSYPDRHLLSGKIVHAFHDSIQRYGRVFAAVHVGRQPVLVVSDYAVATEIFLKNPWPKSRSNIHLLRRFVGRGLLSEEGQVHRRQRKVAYPAFTRKAVCAMTGEILAKAQILSKRLERDIQSSPSGTEAIVNIVDGWNKLALDVIARIGFGFELNALLNEGSTPNPLEAAYDTIIRLMLTGSVYASLRHRLGPVFEQLGRWLGVREQVKLDEARALIARISRELVDNAKTKYARQHQMEVQSDALGSDLHLVEEADGGNDGEDHTLLTLMVKANMSPDLRPHQRLADEELMAIIPTMLFAGHETSTASLAWASLALTQPGYGIEVQHRLRAELLQSADGSDSWRTSAEALDNLPYLDAVVREVLRVHAPVRYLSRTAPRDTVLRLGRPVVLEDGRRTSELLVRKGVQVTLPLQYMNVDEEVWGADAAEFRPERWLPASHPYASKPTDPDASSSDLPPASAPHRPELKAVWSSLMTFGLGPNNCIGQKVAILELKAALATVLSEFAFEPASDPPPEHDFMHGIVARPVVVGEEFKGIQVPIKIRKVAASASATAWR
ncbi:hypothetical protein OC842_004770 [Tilletia horrida]|uniref:Cytochrome P450 n=1 Tax=Tilletia horrida TaxID=155126 RepID=A0AAN6G8K0_9BASI|nr:hypothetical protein OC842_004770 [Tilletia horrida]